MRHQNDSMIKGAFEQPQWYLTKTAYNIRIRVETIQEFLKDSKFENILDIGCGDGSLSLHLLNGNNRITLLDRSKAMLDIALSRVHGAASNRVEALNADFLETQLPAQGFDLIICVGVLAYVENREAFFRKVAALLKPGGTLVTECTDANHLVTYMVRTYALFRRGLIGDRFRTFRSSSSALVAILEKLGFQLSGSFRYSLPLPGFQGLLSQKFSYKSVRFLYGNADLNRWPMLGNECLYCLKYKR